MKRKLANPSASTNTRLPSLWTKKEDEHLLKLASEVKHCNWRIICKLQNKKFKPKTRTPEECEQRFADIKNEPGKKNGWSAGENCALFCNCLLHEGDWEAITLSMPSRSKKDTQKHLLKSIAEVAGLVQDKLYKSVNIKDSTELFKTFTYVKLIMDSLGNEAAYPPVTKLLKKVNLDQKDCLEFLSLLSKEASMETMWTPEKLNKYLLNTVERIQNHHVLTTGNIDPDSTLDGLIHERIEDPIARAGIGYLPPIPPIPYRAIPF